MTLKNQTLFVLLSCLPLLFTQCKKESPEVLPPAALYTYYNCEEAFVVTPEWHTGSATAVTDVLVDHLLLEVAHPGGFVEALQLEGPDGQTFTFTYDDLRRQYHVVNAAHCIILPLPVDHPFWAFYRDTMAAGRWQWRGSVRYRCATGEGEFPTAAGPGMVHFEDCAPAEATCNSEGVSLLRVHIDWHWKVISVQASSPLRLVGRLEMVYPFALRIDELKQLSGSMGIVEIPLPEEMLVSRDTLEIVKEKIRWNVDVLLR